MIYLKLFDAIDNSDPVVIGPVSSVCCKHGFVIIKYAEKQFCFESGTESWIYRYGGTDYRSYETVSEDVFSIAWGIFCEKPILIEPISIFSVKLKEL